MTINGDLQSSARDLLTSGQVQRVIGYETGPRGRVRPLIVQRAQEAERLVWNTDCTHNLTVYLRRALNGEGEHARREAAAPPARAAIVVKPCDSRAINVLLAEKQFARDQVVVIGMACEGIREGAPAAANDAPLQARCQRCRERTPLVHDILLGEPPHDLPAPAPDLELETVRRMAPAERAAFWLGHFERCMRCYACRQACPMCNCPTCLFEQEDALWVGMRIAPSEKRTFHLGRAMHLAGRCVGCDECERVCPVGIPLGLLNRHLAETMASLYGHRAGLEPVLSPITGLLSAEESAA
jgi:formate dehydrogenase (coenzyme F420) beta subunit